VANDAETLFAEWARSEGWTPTKAGWPDFLCFRGDEVMAVEVKWSDGLSQYQRAACDLLALHGIRVFVWTPPGPLMPVRDELVDPSDAYGLGLEVARLREENWDLRERVADLEKALTARAADRQMRRDLEYLIRLTERLKDRPYRLKDIFRRYPELVRGVSPRRRVLSTVSER
jgi:hypothetical protein